jgi:hypothetical protein
MKRLHVAFFVVLLLVASGLIEGCATSGAQLCRRDPLSHPEIRFDDAGNGYVIDDHIYFSKEASGGGHGLGGGGCGCN